MPLINPPAEPSIAPNVTETINLPEVGLSVAVGTTLFMRNLGGTMLNGAIGYPALNNAGTIWYASSASGTGINAQYFGSITNSGLIAAQSSGGEVRTIFIGSSWVGGLVNSGAIYALAPTARAYAIADWDQSATITNQGIIAAQAMDTAIAVSRANGGLIDNQAGGSILAEARSAIAIYTRVGPLDGVNGQPIISIENAGLIAATSTDPKTASVAIYAYGSAGRQFTVHNTGTIQADIAVYMDDFHFSPPSGSRDTIVNEASGTINGALLLGFGNDTVINHGQINGSIHLGLGDDFYDGIAGHLNGVVDLDQGNDRFLGGSDDDAVSGDRGNDELWGGAGADLLIGGRGDDVLSGDAGNDSLYGDFGNDRIITSGGDRVLGGGGDDRIELGDYAFLQAVGGDGFDTLVLPGGTRSLDLQAILNSNRVADFEVVELNGSKQLVVRPGDVGRLTGSETMLRIDGSTGDEVVLVGNWLADAGTITIGGVLYRSFAADGSTILVAEGVAVNISALPPTGSNGLDGVAAGPFALEAGLESGLYLSNSVTTAHYYELFEDLVINADESWYAVDDHPMLTAITGGRDPNLVNWGNILATGKALEGHFGTITNYGLIQTVGGEGTDRLAQNITGLDIYRLLNSVWSSSDPAHAVDADSGYIINVGTIEARSEQEMAIGISNEAIVFASTTNRGLITVVSSAFTGLGMMTRGNPATNTGEINATGAFAAIGVAVTTAPAVITNQGTITATISDGDGTAIGVLFADIYFPGQNRLDNSGSITATLAITSGYNDSSIIITNTGQITGRIQLDAVISPAMGTSGAGADDQIFNRGTITGEVWMGVGIDRYDGTGGVQAGAIHGEAGMDMLRGTAGSDQIDGGADDDIIFSSGGGDALTGGTGRDTFVFGLVTLTPDRITDFTSGQDHLNLSLVNPTSVTIGSSGGLTLLSVATAAGSFTIEVSGRVAMSDIHLSTSTFTGTSGNDALIAVAGGSHLFGGEGRDLLIGLSGDDVLDGGTTDDRDVMEGGAGNDTYHVTYNDTARELAGGGYDTFVVTPGFTFNLPENFERFVGGSGYGNRLDNIMIGSAGSDFLDGREGNDRLSGGLGDDFYAVEGPNDLVFENPDEGIDLVLSYGNLYLYQNVENLSLYGQGDMFLADEPDLFGVGNELDNTITGNTGDNLLLGGAGNDQLLGNRGNDALFGEAGNDRLRGGFGIDFLVGGEGDDLLEGMQGADALYGGDGNDTLYADTLNSPDPNGGASFGGFVPTEFVTDILVGGAGNDIFYANSGKGDYDLIDGGAGDDVFWVDTGDDLTFEALGGGIDTVHADVRVANAGVYLWANVENLVLEGTTTFGVGNELDNTLTGNASVNLLLGGAGNDTINGRGGNDVLFGEAGNDRFVFTAGTGGDVIGDFTQGQDKIDISAFGFSFAQAQANFIQNGNVGAINLGNGDFIVLHNVTMSTLTAADFIFAAVAEPAPKGGPPVMEPLGDWGGEARANLLADAIQFASDDLHWLRPQAEAFI